MSCYRTPIVAVPTVILELLTNPSKMKFLALHWSGSCWGDSAVPRLVCDRGGLYGQSLGLSTVAQAAVAVAGICPGCRHAISPITHAENLGEQPTSLESMVHPLLS